MSNIVQKTMYGIASIGIAAVACLFFAATASAATITWDGGGIDNDWDTPENWDTDTVPTSVDDVVFDSTSTSDVEIGDSSLTSISTRDINSLTISSGYTGTINNYDGLRPANGYSQAAGTVNNYNVVSAGTSYTQTGGTMISDSTYKSTHFFLDSFTLTGGTFTAPDVIYFDSDVTVSSGATYNHNNGQTFFTGTSVVDFDSSLSIYRLTISSNNKASLDNSLFLSAGDTLIVEGDAHIRSGAIIATDTGASIELRGEQNDMGFYDADATFVFSGTADQIINTDNFTSSTTRFDIEVDKTSGTAYPYSSGGGPCAEFSSVTVTSGTLDCNTYSLVADFDGDFAINGGIFLAPKYTMNIAGDFTLSTSGTFTLGTYTDVIFDGTDTATITGDITFYDFTCQTPGKTLVFEAGSTTTVTNDFTVDGNVGGYVTLVSDTSGSVWYLDVVNDFVSYVDVMDSDATAGSTISASSSIDSGNNTGWSISAPSASATKMMAGEKEANPSKSSIGKKEKKDKDGMSW